MMKLKPIKEDLKEKAGEVVGQLEAQREDFLNQVDFLKAKVDDVERKIRWLKREILD